MCLTWSWKEVVSIVLTSGPRNQPVRSNMQTLIYFVFTPVYTVTLVTWMKDAVFSSLASFSYVAGKEWWENENIGSLDGIQSDTLTTEPTRSQELNQIIALTVWWRVHSWIDSSGKDLASIYLFVINFSLWSIS